MAIRRTDRRRLARLAMPLAYAERHAVEHRVGQRALVEQFEMTCVLLATEGIDPESTCVPDRLREAEAELAAMPDTPELQRADEDYLACVDTSWIDAEWERGRRYRPPPREEKTFDGEVERLIGRFRADAQIDIAKASPFDLFAWCLSRHGATYDEAANNLAEIADDLLLSLEAEPDEPAPGDPERGDLIEEHQ